MNTRYGDSDDIWGDDPAAAHDDHVARDGNSRTSGSQDAWGSESAFADDPIRVIDSADTLAPDDAAESALDAADDAGGGKGSKGPTSKQAKPNMAILGVAALIGMGVLGGGGWMAWNMLAGGSTGDPQIREATLVAPPAPSEAASGGHGQPDGQAAKSVESSMVAGAQDGAAAAAVNIFGDDKPLDPNASGAQPSGASVSQALSASPAQAPSSTGESTAAPTSAAVAQAAAQVAAAASAAASAAPSGNATPTAAPTAAPPQGGAMQQRVRAAVQHKDKVGPAQTPPSLAAERRLVAKPKAKPQTAPVTQAKAAPRRDSARHGESAKASAKAPQDVRREVFVDDEHIRVFAVYPPSGKFAQAWMRSDKDSALAVVREGDAYRGSRVKEVQAERLRVVLEDGRYFDVNGPGRLEPQEERHRKRRQPRRG